MLWQDCQNLDDIRVCMVSNFRDADTKLEREGWILQMGFRQACDIFTQVWRHRDSNTYAYTITQNDDWDGQSSPNGGVYKTFLELLEHVPEVCYGRLIEDLGTSLRSG